MTERSFHCHGFFYIGESDCWWCGYPNLSLYRNRGRSITWWRLDIFRWRIEIRWVRFSSGKTKRITTIRRRPQWEHGE